MNPSDWLSLIVGIAGTLVAVVPLTWRRSDRQRITIEKLEVENRMLRETRNELKMQLFVLRNLGQAADRMLSALPSPTPEGSES